MGQETIAEGGVGGDLISLRKSIYDPLKEILVDEDCENISTAECRVIIKNAFEVLGDSEFTDNLRIAGPNKLAMLVGGIRVEQFKHPEAFIGDQTTLLTWINCLSHQLATLESYLITK